MTVFFHNEANAQPTVVDITLDWAYFDLDREWDLTHHKRAAAAVIGAVLSGPPGETPKHTSQVTPLRARIARVVVSDGQKALLKKRIDRDFGLRTWARLPETFKANLWLSGRGTPTTPGHS